MSLPRGSSSRVVRYRLLGTIFCRSIRKDSITALSPVDRDDATRPMDPTMPLLHRVMASLFDLDSTPRSLCTIVPAGHAARSKPIQGSSVVLSRIRRSPPRKAALDHPQIRLDSESPKLSDVNRPVDAEGVNCEATHRMIIMNSGLGLPPEPRRLMMVKGIPCRAHSLHAVPPTVNPVAWINSSAMSQYPNSRSSACTS